ncbi:methyltransferase domain-containing protein [Peribacillus sp. NPDC006672]|uniref:methyltransferase domain-containing protein n=1 Tax=Peribacillus sp. NPDC006672 TaxID=3390606 RepID=UPI003D085EAD
MSYDGVEGSINMVGEATKNLNGTEGNVHLTSMETWNFQTENYDLVVSRLAQHYLAELKDIFQEVHGSLANNGNFIFSVQHPVLTSALKSAVASSSKADWIVHDHFNSGERIEPWKGLLNIIELLKNIINF